MYCDQFEKYKDIRLSTDSNLHRDVHQLTSCKEVFPETVQ